jgi:hypothetical protein
MKKHTHGNWNPRDEKLLFIAGNNWRRPYGFAKLNLSDDPLLPRFLNTSMEERKYVHKLCSLRDFTPQNFREDIAIELEDYKYLFIDSGIFGLAMDYAKAADISHNEALTTPIAEIPGWPAFRDFYIDLCRFVKDDCWGYVELDLGGTQQKIATRTWLEEQGLEPIPVWHPLYDGIDYGRYLMERYDRICLGNIVKSDAKTRMDVLEAMTMAKQEFPDVWVHALGLGPVDFCTSYNINSMDATSWLSPVMYARSFVYAQHHAFTREGRYYETEKDGVTMLVAMTKCQVQAQSQQENWLNYQRSKEQYYGNDNSNTRFEPSPAPNDN